MKSFAAVCAAVLLALFAVPAIHAQASQSLIPGMQVRVTLSSGLSTTVAHNGDPFTGVVADRFSPAIRLFCRPAPRFTAP